MKLIKSSEIFLLVTRALAAIRVQKDYAIPHLFTFLPLLTISSPRVTVNDKLSTVN